MKLGGFVSVSCTALFLASCGSTLSEEDRNSEVIGSTQISWSDFLKISKMHREVVAVAPGESVYLFVATSTEQIRLSNGKTVPPESCISASTTYEVVRMPVASQPYGSTKITTSRIDNDLHRECRAKIRARDEKLSRQKSFTEFVRLAEQAVKQDGSCVWLGYDRAFDLMMRSIGAVTHANDERLFFSKLRCG